MREPVTRAESERRLDAGAFDAAVERVVAGLISAPADDTAGARVIARLLATPSRRGSTPRLLLAPAAALLVVLVVAYVQHAPYSPIQPTTAPPPATPPATAANATPTPAGTAEAGDETRDARLLLIGATPRAVASGARRRSQAGAATPPVDQDTALPPIDTAAAIDLGALDDSSEPARGPTPLPVDALELITLDLDGVAPRHEN